jgi:hypothetical protein
MFFSFMAKVQTPPEFDLLLLLIPGFYIFGNWAPI